MKQNKYDMNNKTIFYLQTVWVGLMGGCTFSLSRIISENYWLSIPLFLLMWAVVSFIGIGFISLCNPDNRLCAKYGIKIENLPLYRKAFEQLVEAEKRGEDTQWIGDGLPDKDEWLRFLSYEIKNGIKR